MVQLLGVGSVWWLGRKQGLVVNGKRVLRVMRERGLLVRHAASGSRAEGLEQGGSAASQSRLAVGHDQDLGRTQCRLGVSGLRDRLLHARDRRLGLESALPHGQILAALNRAVLEVLPFGSRGTGLTLTTDNGTQFTSPVMSKL